MSSGVFNRDRRTIVLPPHKTAAEREGTMGSQHWGRKRKTVQLKGGGRGETKERAFCNCIKLKRPEEKIDLPNPELCFDKSTKIPFILRCGDLRAQAISAYLTLKEHHISWEPLGQDKLYVSGET